MRGVDTREVPRAQGAPPLRVGSPNVGVRGAHFPLSLGLFVLWSLSSLPTFWSSPRRASFIREATHKHLLQPAPTQPRAKPSEARPSAGDAAGRPSGRLTFVDPVPAAQAGATGSRLQGAPVVGREVHQRAAGQALAVQRVHDLPCRRGDRERFAFPRAPWLRITAHVHYYASTTPSGIRK